MATKQLKDMPFFLSDSDGDGELPLNPDGRPKKDDVSEPVFLRHILFIYGNIYGDSWDEFALA